MSTSAPTAAAADLAHYIVGNPGILMGSLLAETFRSRFAPERFTDLAERGVAMQLNDGRSLLIWPDVVVLAAADGTHDACWRSAEWEHDLHGTVLAILAEVEQAGVGPTQLEAFDALLKQVVELLAKQGITASVEHPGCIVIPLPGKEHLLCAGTANGEWGYDHTREGVVIDDSMPCINKQAGAAQVAGWLTRAHRFHAKG